MPVLASADVADEALQRTHEIVTHLLAGRPDILEAMAKYGTRLIIIGKDQVYTDMPEYRDSPNPAYQNERVRGTGGLRVTSFGEENLLNLAGDRYDDESIGVHEFCHTIDAALGRIDPTWRDRLGTDLPERGRRRAVEERLRRLQPGRILGRDLPVVLRLQPDQQLESQRRRHARATEAVRPRGLRPGPDDLQTDSREGLEAPGAAPAAERHPAAGPVQDRPLLHQVHVCAGVPGARVEQGQRRGVAQGQ